MVLKVTNKKRRRTDVFDMTEEKEVPQIMGDVNRYLGYAVIGVLILALLMPFIL